jgi:hypothetical protein
MVVKTGQVPLRIVLFSALALVLALLARTGSAHAQGVGVQGGFALDPEQVYVGSHYETGDLARGLHVRPGIDGAFGGGFSIASINIDILYKVDINPRWQIYQGGGPSIHIFRFGEPAETDLTGGFSGVFGFAHQGGFFTEFRWASGRGHGLKLGVGFTLR